MKIASPATPRITDREPFIEPEVAGGLMGAAAGLAISAGAGALLYATGELSSVAAVFVTAGISWFVTPSSALLGSMVAGVRASERGP